MHVLIWTLSLFRNSILGSSLTATIKDFRHALAWLCLSSATLFEQKQLSGVLPRDSSDCQEVWLNNDLSNNILEFLWLQLKH